jgi:hypothetical protein
LGLDLVGAGTPGRDIDYPTKSIAGFLDFMTAALPDGDIYLFGGVLRDLALLGQRGFNSDIDLVVEGDWDNCARYLRSLGAAINKFGGYRFTVAGWPVDIWSAKETWAIRQGIVSYRGIGSLTQTTVLNWDAILMNWRTRTFIHCENYIEAINARLLDIVLEQNPNPLGMAVRVFRHLYLKDAAKVTSGAAEYLAKCASTYSFETIRREEMRSYGNSVVSPSLFRWFERANEFQASLSMNIRYGIASDLLRQELGIL